MPDLSNDPLELYQVLEEEFVSLHGQLTEWEKVTLHKREGIVARLDWKFDKSHINDAAGLARKLRRDEELYKHLRRVSPELEGKLAAYENTAALERLTEALNELLRREIYDQEAFKFVDLKASTKELINIHASSSPALPDRLAHINRLLLEEIFADELERISDLRLAAMYQRLHREKTSALCLSGGGIRSGTFALGLIQKLACYGLLEQFDYLSTVSGGGYIGSWLTAWLHRHPGGLRGVVEESENSSPKSKTDPDPPAIQHLREYSNFITPKIGFLTADTWAFITIYLRNLLLNWLVLIPLLAAVLGLPRLLEAVYLAQPVTPHSLDLFGYACRLRLAFLIVGAALLILSLTYINLSRPGVNKQIIERSSFWRTRLRQGSFLKYCLSPLVCGMALLTTYWAWFLDEQASRSGSLMLRPFILFGVALPFLASVLYALVLRRYKHLKEFSRWEIFIILLLLAAGGAGGALAYVVATAYAASGAAWLDPNASDVTDPWRTWGVELYTCFAVPLLLLVILLATTLFVGLTSRARGIDDEDREWWARFEGWVFIAIIVWVSLNTLVIFGPWMLLEFPKLAASIGGISGLLALLAGRSSRTPANEERAGQKGLLAAIIGNHILPLLAFAFLSIFLICLSLGTSLLLQSIAAPPGYTLWPFGYQFDLAGQPLDFVTHMRVVHYASLPFVASFIGIAALTGGLLGLFFNLNKFSLHAGYRNRLIRAFLGATRSEAERNPNPFTGFDPGDNIYMHELRPVLFHENDFTDLRGLAVSINAEQNDLSAFLKAHLSDETLEALSAHTDTTPLEPRLKIDLIEDINRILENDAIRAVGELLVENPPPPTTSSMQTDEAIVCKRQVLTQAYPDCIKNKYPPAHKLLHVVNLALNLVGGHNLAWQQRKAETFAVTPLHAGCHRLGYRRSKCYGGANGISLGTAAAVSGAAVSSNMGYYTSSPLLSIVLTLFNARLGWWLGNPGAAGEKTYHRSSPKLSITPIIEEAFGLTDDTGRYVYLSDGGHFENLALYEMVLRRCHIIIASDGAQDKDYEFDDLGNAIRKIRIDLGVHIEFDDVPIYKEAPQGKQGRYCAFGRIRYSAVDGDDVKDGVLIYIKPAIYGREPRDVLQYKKSNNDFPHQTTGDQFFDEPQFESYRMLGAYIMDRLCDNELGKGGQSAKLTIHQFVEQAYKNYARPDSRTFEPLESDWLSAWIKNAPP
ncbi:MAG: patatin-like phospholipase family protein [Pyrinomonadaceae bacterium]